MTVRYRIIWFKSLRESKWHYNINKSYPLRTISQKARLRNNGGQEVFDLYFFYNITCANYKIRMQLEEWEMCIWHENRITRFSPCKLASVEFNSEVTLSKCCFNSSINCRRLLSVYFIAFIWVLTRETSSHVQDPEIVPPDTCAVDDDEKESHFPCCPIFMSYTHLLRN
jgi:hypothetical protein